MRFIFWLHLVHHTSNLQKFYILRFESKAHVSYSDHDKFKYRDLMLSNAPFVIYFHNSVTVLTLSFHFDFFLSFTYKKAV